MTRTFKLLCVTAGLALAAPLPALAQAEAASTQAQEMEQAMSVFSGMFPVEPLTAEQEARLPQATRIVARMIPEGALAEMMDSMFDQIMNPMMQGVGEPAATTVAESLGLSTFDLDLTEEQSAELATIFDPAFEDRREREMAVFSQLMVETINVMEPGMRRAMSELYAINFSPTELDEIEAFFSTETGGKYARESFLMASDPRIMASSMEALPALMGSIGDMEKRMAESVADLPAVRSFGGLSPEERAKVTQMTGLTEREIAGNILRTLPVIEPPADYAE